METGYSLAFQNFIKIASKIDYLDEILIVTSTYHATEELNIDKVKIIRPKRNLRNKLERIAYFVLKAIKMRNTKIDLVILETFDYALITHLFSKEQRKKIVVRVHGTSETEYTWNFPGFAYKLSRSIQRSILKRGLPNLWATTNYYIEFYKRVFYKYDDYKMSKVYFETMPNPLPELQLRAEMDFENNDFEYDFLILGRMDKRGIVQKGFDTLATALVVLKKNYDKEFRVLWIGAGDYEDVIKSYLYQNQLEKNVFFQTNLSNADILTKLIKCKWVILNSRFEGASMFALEALANNKPVLTTCAGGLSDYFNGRNGIRIEEQTPIGVYNALVEALNTNIDAYEQYKEENRILSQNYLSEKIGEKLKMVMTSVVESIEI